MANSNTSSETGFSLLELVVVISVLSILASLSIPTIGNIIKQSRIDEVKAKINSAAADCLQKLRTSEDANIIVDSSIISDNNLEEAGYKISNNANKCSYFSVEPIDNKETYLFPMSFGISRGKLTKFAIPKGQDSLTACKAWAGENCKESKELKELIAYNEQIAVSKLKCEEQYNQWINAGSSGSINRWNPNADSGCASVPPKVVSPTCTPSGCNRKIYALDGVVVGYTQGDYDKALEEKYGRICTENIEKLRTQKPPFTNPKDAAYSIKECGPQEFWFYKGTDLGDGDEWRSKMCDDEINIKKDSGQPFEGRISFCGEQTMFVCNGEKLANKTNYDACLAENESQACQSEINEMVKTNPNGKYVHSSNGRTQTPCGDTFWICENDYKDSLDKYEEDERCRPKPKERTVPVNQTMCDWGYTEYCP